MDNSHYESILKLLKELHKTPPTASSSSPPQTTQSEDDLSSVGHHSNDGRNSRCSTSQSLALQIDAHPLSSPRKRSIFDFRIPMLTVTGSPYSSPDTADGSDNRKFSFSHFRRHSNVYKVWI